MEAQKEHALRWVLELKAGTYKKVNYALTKEGGYCCLGVGCLVNKIPMNYEILKETVGLKDSLGEFQISWLKRLFSNDKYNSLVTLNDCTYSEDQNHKNIYKEMKKHKFIMFVPEVQQYLIKNT